MNRLEFMKQLARLLDDLPREEKIEVLKYYNGYFDDAGAENEAEIIAQQFAENLEPREGISITEEIVCANGEPKSITDKMDVTQGKLCMGFRCGENTSKDNYPATIVYNSIFSIFRFS